MTKYAMVVYSDSKPGRSAEYMDWYKNVHLGDICAVPGVKSGRVFEAIPASPAQPATAYLAIYELDTDNPETVLQEMDRRHQAGKMKSTEAIDPTSARITLYKQNF